MTFTSPSSLSDVPDDVLRCIFEAYLPKLDLFQVAAANSPYTLALVCKEWKDHVFSSPKLWTSLDITCDPTVRCDEETMDRLVAHVQAWFRRSPEEMPLSFRIEFQRIDPNPPFQPYGEHAIIARCLRRLLSNYSHRYELLQILIPFESQRHVNRYYYEFQGLPAAKSNHFPCLRSFELDLGGCRAQLARLTFPFPFDLVKAPKLNTIVTYCQNNQQPMYVGGPLVRWLDPNRTPWNQLRSFIMKGGQLVGPTIMPSSLNLVHLAFWNVVVSSLYQSGSFTELELPLLRTLDWCDGWNQREVAPFLPASAPHLERLRFIWAHGGSENQIQDVVDWLAGQSCTPAVLIFGNGKDTAVTHCRAEFKWRVGQRILVLSKKACQVFEELNKVYPPLEMEDVESWYHRQPLVVTKAWTM